MKKLLLVIPILLVFLVSHAKNSLATSGDAYINSSVPSNHGGGYNALWMPNAAALMPENSSAYAGIMLTANLVRNGAANNWRFANFRKFRRNLGTGDKWRYGRHIHCDKQRQCLP